MVRQPLEEHRPVGHPLLRELRLDLRDQPVQPRPVRAGHAGGGVRGQEDGDARIARGHRQVGDVPGPQGDRRVGIVSQSGATADTWACLCELKRRGVRCLGIVNAVGSSIAREVDGGVYVHVGPEISVASTKAFTSQVAAIVLFGLVMAQAKGVGPHELGSFIKELDALPDEITSVIARHESDIQSLAKTYATFDHSLFIGRDTLYPVALEGALKLKEISYIQAEGHAAGELKHGPIALVDDSFFEVAFVADNWLYEKSISNLIEVNARGGHVIAVTDATKDVPAEAVVRIDSNIKLLVPLLFNVVSQLLAYYVSLERGNDVDQPRNLAKSVTVE